MRWFSETVKAANTKLRAYARRHGAFALQTAISSGQWRHRKGVYYGGGHEAWSARMLKDVFRDELSHAERLTVVDFHTGLGDCGAAEMITEDLPGSEAYARAKSLWRARLRSSEAGESLSAPLKGTIDKAAGGWMAGGTLTFAALEVGTAPVREVLSALRPSATDRRRGARGRTRTIGDCSPQIANPAALSPLASTQPP